MKTSLALVAALLAVSLGTHASADKRGIQVGPPRDDPGSNTPAAVGLVDAWNDTETPQSVYVYGADCWGYPYRPSKTYDLDRVEFYAGDLEGLVTVSVLADDGSGFPTGPVLGSVTYKETSPRRWQGASLTPTVPLTGGALYHIRYQVLVGSLASVAQGGHLIPHAWSFNNCVSWDGIESSTWMARFYDEAVTATRPGTWGAIKTLYR